MAEAFKMFKVARRDSGLQTICQTKPTDAEYERVTNMYACLAGTRKTFATSAQFLHCLMSLSLRSSPSLIPSSLSPNRRLCPERL